MAGYINNEINNRGGQLYIYADNGDHLLITNEYSSFSFPQIVGGESAANAVDIKIEPPGNIINHTKGSGTETILGVVNYNSGAGANSYLYLKANNTSSNAYLELNTTANTWTLGSVPDGANTKFVVTPSAVINSNNVMEVTESGKVNFPGQPCFLAFKDATSTNVTGNATNYTVPFNSEVYDIGSNYNNATGVFTAPVTGKYWFSFAVRLGDITSSHTARLAVFTSNRSYALCARGASLMMNSSGQATFYGEIFTDMDAADTMYVQMYSNGEGTDANDVIGDGTGLYTYICGRLVC